MRSAILMRLRLKAGKTIRLPFPMAYTVPPGPETPEPGRRNRAAGTVPTGPEPRSQSHRRCTKNVKFIHTKFDHKVDYGDGQSVPKFGGLLSQKCWGSFVQGTLCYTKYRGRRWRNVRGRNVRVPTKLLELVLWWIVYPYCVVLCVTTIEIIFLKKRLFKQMHCASLTRQFHVHTKSPDFSGCFYETT
jgi:hypothetical protein